MYTPKYYITNKILHFIVQFEIAFRDIESLPLPRKEKKKVQKRMKIENGYYISKLLGIDLSRNEIKSILVGKKINIFEKPAVLLVNYRNIIEFIDQMEKDKYLTLSPGTLLHINKLVTQNWNKDWDCGRFRSFTEEPSLQFDRWTNPNLDKEKVVNNQQELGEIIDWVQETRFLVHPLIKIAVMIYELYFRAPFIAGNQLTLLGIIEMLYSQFNLSQKGLIPISRHFYTYEDEYKESLKGSHASDDLTSWIESFVRGVSLDLENLKDELYRLEEEKVQRKKELLLGLNSRQLQILNELKSKVKISRSDYADMMGISFMTAYRDLDELVDRKLIYRYGHGRSTYYTAHPKDEGEKKLKSRSQYEKVGDISDNISNEEDQNKESYVTKMETF
jgi:Fic family protein